MSSQGVHGGVVHGGGGEGEAGTGAGHCALAGSQLAIHAAAPATSPASAAPCV